MSIFIADHMAKIGNIGGLVRPVHIGAALFAPADRGPEPDCLTQPNLSEKVAYADLRLHHYVAGLGLPKDQVIALMQYRRMYYLRSPAWYDLQGRRLRHKSSNGATDSIKVAERHRNGFLRQLSALTQDDLVQFLGKDTAVMSGHALSEGGLQPGYLAGSEALFPGDARYIDVWFALREVLQARVGPDLLKGVFDQQAQAYFHNTMVTTWGVFKDYADFLFGVLDELRDFADAPRMFGYLGERIQTVYVLHQQQTNAAFNIRTQPLMFYKPR